VSGRLGSVPENAYEAAAQAKVLEAKDLDPVKDELSATSDAGRCTRIRGKRRHGST